MKKLLKYMLGFFIGMSVINIFVLWQIEGQTFKQAFFVTIMLFGAGEPLNINFEKISTLSGILMVLQTLLGLASLTISFGVLANFLLSEKISKFFQAREKVKLKNHVILCGLGDLGFKVIKELELMGETVAIIDRGDEKHFIQQAKEKGHKIIIGNLKEAKLLELAGIKNAKSIIICTRDILCNVSIALTAREKREDIEIVLRIRDEDLSQKLSDTFQIKRTFSSAVLGSSAFAAASYDRRVFQNIKIDNTFFVSANIEIFKDGQLDGVTLNEVLQKDLSILKLVSGGEKIIFPRGERKLSGGDEIFITCTMETLKEIIFLNSQGSLLFPNKENDENKHIIICGLGFLGFKIMKDLEKMGESAVVIDKDDSKGYLELAKEAGHKVIIGDLGSPKTLEAAGIKNAKSVIICTSDDVQNLNIALNVRKINKEIMVVLRMADQELAQKLSKSINIKASFSSKTLAAPAFAAASYDKRVFQTSKVGTRLFVSGKIEVQENSNIKNMSLAKLYEKDLAILKLKSNGNAHIFPNANHVLKVGDILYITCSLDLLQELK